MLEFLKAPFLFLDICNIAVCADDTTLYSNCDEGFDFLQKQELDSELDSNIQDTRLARKWHVHFNAGKT